MLIWQKIKKYAILSHQIKNKVMKIISALVVPASGNYTVEFTGMISGITFRVENAAGCSFGGMKGVLYIQSNQGGKRHTVHDSVKLIDLAELCTMDKESSIKLNYASAFSGAAPEVLTAGVCTKAEFKIDVTADGRGLRLNDGEKWVLELTGMTAGDTLNAFAHESTEDTLMPINYQVLTTSTFPNQRFKLNGADRMAVMKHGSLDSVEIIDNHRQIKKVLDELSSEIRNGFGQCYLLDYLLGAGGNLTVSQSINEGVLNYLMPCSTLDEVQINCTGATAIQVVLMKW